MARWNHVGGFGSASIETKINDRGMKPDDIRIMRKHTIDQRFLIMLGKLEKDINSFLPSTVAKIYSKVRD